MSGESSEQNRSEAPSDFKLKKAREKGSVARGMDLGFLTGGVTFLIYAWTQGEALRAQVGQAARNALIIAPQLVTSEEGMLEATGAMLLSVARPLGFLMAVVFLAVLVFEVIQVGGLMFAAEALKPDFNRLNPAAGLKRVFSVRMLVETFKSVLKLAVYGAIAVLVVRGALVALPPVITDGSKLAEVMVRQGLRLLSLFMIAALAFALFDQLVARRDFQKRMRMSRREVKREHKDREGDPRLKQKRKDLHRGFVAASRSLRGIRGADVLITNPTHFAVGLRYDPARMEAPEVVSRGRDQFALRLRRLAFLYGVVIVENPSLARALYRCELDRAVPEVFYDPVADVYRALRSRGVPAEREVHA